jgi:hypothetical protein
MLGMPELSMDGAFALLLAWGLVVTAMGGYDWWRGQ